VVVVVVVLRGVWCCDSLTVCQRKKLRVASRYEVSSEQLGAVGAEERDCAWRVGLGLRRNGSVLI
jgi:hypothetical protein